MSIRHGLLAILAEHPTHGYGLKSSFEISTAGAWPLNVGQVYTTLGRLERDGLVESIDSDGPRQSWRITEAGREMLDGWYFSPTDEQPPRDELIIKVLLAVSDREVDARAVVRTQRSATMRRLQAYTRTKREAMAGGEPTRALLLDALILAADAESRWLDACDEHLRLRDAVS